MEIANLAGQTLGKYEILEEIGRGGMGVVYKARDTALGRLVAVKVLAPYYTANPEFVERFRREARAAARLDHPNIVTIYDVARVDGYDFIAMKYLKGESLAAVIRRDAPLPLGRVVGILTQVGRALDYAHAQKVIHRDVKPGNILIADDDRAVLTDFGVAWSAEATHLTQTGIVLGTPAYVSPEQITGRPVGPEADLYALAVVAYEMLAGHPPFEGETASVLHAQVYTPPPPLDQVNPRISPQVAAVVGNGLAKDPARRYPTSADFVRAIGAAVEVTETGIWRPAPPAARPEPAPRPAPPGPTLPRQPVPTNGDAAPPAQPTPRAKPAPPRPVKQEPAGAGPTPARQAGSRPAPARQPGGRFVPLLLGSLLGLLLMALVVAGAIRFGEQAGRGLAAWVASLPRILPQPQVPGAAATRAPAAGATAPGPATPGPGDLKPAPLSSQQLQRERQVEDTIRTRGNGQTIFAHRVPRSPKIDGDLGDWTGVIYPIPFFVPDAGGKLRAPRSAADLSGRFLIAWDEQNLYVGVDVTDDVHVQTQTGANIYLGDSIEIHLDTRLYEDFPDNRISADDFQLGLSPGNFANIGPSAYIWRPETWMADNKGGNIRVAARPRPGGYRVEAAIPWASLNTTPADRLALGMSLNVDDNDTPGTARQESMISQSPAHRWGDPTSYGTLVLLD